jgi:putative Ca2+/H+ antiporter (TMEM165/GDT1 family)
MDKLEIEDSLLCKSITNGLSKEHFGLNVLIREWVALAFSRRSFSLLARASFIAAKMKIPMDDILSNQSKFAAATDSEPMEFLARDLLLPKNERVTLGYPIELQEVPWDLFEAIQIDPKRPEESVRNRWIAIRWTCQGISRFWSSPLFSRDFATVEEVGEVFAANNGDKEVIDLFFPKSEKQKFAQGIFNLLFVNHKPNMEPFVIRHECKVNKRNHPVPIAADVIQTMKIVDLDSMFHYFEIQFRDRQPSLIGDKTSSRNKREHVDVDPIVNDPIMGDNSIEFTDIEVTDEMEEFLKLISGE